MGIGHIQFFISDDYVKTIFSANILSRALSKLNFTYQSEDTFISFTFFFMQIILGKASIFGREQRADWRRSCLPTNLSPLWAGSLFFVSNFVTICWIIPRATEVGRYPSWCRRPAALLGSVCVGYLCPLRRGGIPLTWLGGESDQLTLCHRTLPTHFLGGIAFCNCVFPL